MCSLDMMYLHAQNEISSGSFNATDQTGTHLHAVVTENTSVLNKRMTNICWFEI